MLAGPAQLLRDDGATDSGADHDHVVQGLRRCQVVGSLRGALGEDHRLALALTGADGSHSKVGPAWWPSLSGSGLASKTTSASARRAEAKSVTATGAPPPA